MLTKIKEKIELNRKSKNPFWKILVSLKDLIWICNLLRERHSNKIQTMNFAVTFLCNSKCKTCNIWKIYQKNPEKFKQELTLEEIKKIFNSSRNLKKIKTINLTGGEASLRKDFVELFGFFLKKYPNSEIGITTNAINPDIIFNKFKEIDQKYKPKKILLGVSLDGIGETHNKQRGIKNYKKVIYFIEKIEKIEKIKSIELTLNFTITPQNYNDLLKVFSLAKKYNIQFMYQFAQASTCYYDNNKKDKNIFKWETKKLNEVSKSINLIRKEDYKSEKSFFEKNPKDYFLKKMVEFYNNPKRNFNCYSGKNSFFMDPYGDVFPCIMLNKKIGNAKEGFDKLWKSNTHKKINQYIKKRKCSCWTPCETISSLNKNFKFLFKKNN